jgi:hypothetical protein
MIDGLIALGAYKRSLSEADKRRPREWSLTAQQVSDTPRKEYPGCPPRAPAQGALCAVVPDETARLPFPAFIVRYESALFREGDPQVAYGARIINTDLGTS